MDRTDALAFGARFVGAMLVAVGIGGAVVGGYAAVQEPAGLCGDPTLVVQSAAGPASATDAALAASALSAPERAAFVEAVEGPAGEGTVAGAVTTDRLRNGTAVEYRGERYYATVGSLNRCVSVDPLVFPFGATLLVLGGVAFAGPTLRRRYEEYRDS